MSVSDDKLLSGCEVRSAMPGVHSTASASMVNRTHRVVRERAKAMDARRNRVRSLWIPMMVCSALLVIVCSAAWIALDGYEMTPNGMPDSSNQLMVLLLWFFPVSATVLGMVWFRRTRAQADDEAGR